MSGQVYVAAVDWTMTLFLKYSNTVITTPQRHRQTDDLQ